MYKGINLKQLNLFQQLLLTLLVLNFVFVICGFVLFFNRLFVYSDFEPSDVTYSKFLYTGRTIAGRDITTRAIVVDLMQHKEVEVVYGYWVSKIDTSTEFEAGYVIFDSRLQECPYFVFVRQGDKEILPIQKGLRSINQTLQSSRELQYYAVLSFMVLLVISYIYQKLIYKPEQQ